MKSTEKLDLTKNKDKNKRGDHQFFCLLIRFWFAHQNCQRNWDT